MTPEALSWAPLYARTLQRKKISVNAIRNSKGTPAAVGACMHAQAQCGSRSAGWESAGDKQTLISQFEAYRLDYTCNLKCFGKMKHWLGKAFSTATPWSVIYKGNLQFGWWHWEGKLKLGQLVIPPQKMWFSWNPISQHITLFEEVINIHTAKPASTSSAVPVTLTNTSKAAGHKSPSRLII